jgi:hypothetical protein
VNAGRKTREINFLSLFVFLCAFASLREISLWNCDDLATLD